MAVAVFVMADQHFGQGSLDLLQVPLVLGQCGHVFHQIEQAASVAVGHSRQQVQHLIVQLYLKILRAAPRQLHQLSPAQRAQAQHMQARKELAGDTERRIFRGRGQQGQLARFHQGQKEILLRFGKTVQFVQHQNFHPGQSAAQMLQTRLGRAEPQIFSARGFSQQQGQGGFAAAGRAEKKQAGQALGLHQGTQPIRQMALTQELRHIVWAHTFGQRLADSHVQLSACSAFRPGNCEDHQ